MHLCKWRQGLRKERKGLKADRMMRHSKNPPDPEPIKQLTTSSVVLQRLSVIAEKCRLGEVIVPADVNRIVAFIFTLLFLCILMDRGLELSWA